MKSIELSYNQVVADLVELASARPDYVYRDYGQDLPRECVYFEPDGAPSCIVGHVLAKHGLTLDDTRYVSRYSGSRLTWNDGTDVNTLVQRGVIEVSDKNTLAVLLTAQAEQDTGATWGEAVKKAVTNPDVISTDFDDEPYSED